jgi:hypothetical protein
LPVIREVAATDFHNPISHHSSQRASTESVLHRFIDMQLWERVSSRMWAWVRRWAA